jgi:hypothetical protein
MTGRVEDAVAHGRRLRLQAPGAASRGAGHGISATFTPGLLEVERNTSLLSEAVGRLEVGLKMVAPGSRSPGVLQAMSALLGRARETNQAVFGHLRRALRGLTDSTAAAATGVSLTDAAQNQQMLSFSTSFVSLYAYCEELLGLAERLCRTGGVEVTNELYQHLFDLAHAQRQLQEIQLQSGLRVSRAQNEFTARTHLALLVGSAQCYYYSAVTVSSVQRGSEFLAASRTLSEPRSLLEALVGRIYEQLGLAGAFVADHSEYLPPGGATAADLADLRDKLLFNLCPAVRHRSEGLETICSNVAVL